MLIRWLAWKLFGAVSVALIDYDGDVSPRFVRGPSHCRMAVRMGFGITVVRLLPEGAIDGGGYVKSWIPLFGNTTFAREEISRVGDKIAEGVA